MGRDHAAIADIRDALGSSLSLREVVRAAQPPLMRLLGGDHAALGFVASDAAGESTGSEPEPGRLEWVPSDGLPTEFFRDYERWAAHDFVLKAVVRCPRTVLLDSEMVSRAALVENSFYRRARELGVPLQHVMAVMLDVDATGSGLSVYRESKRPFGDRERALLQRVTPALAQAVRNCLRFEHAEQRGRLLALTNRDRAEIIFDLRARELFRTQRATQLLQRWFAGASSSASLPDRLSNDVREWLTQVGHLTPTSLSQPESKCVLVVTPHWVADGGLALLSLVLDERPRPPWSPEAWAQLTPRQRAVVAGVARGWDNQLIGSELGCRVATVKTHLTQIYNKLGMGSRSQLMAAVLVSSPEST